eukprot:CAMPEP_0173121416 /NCGR_PEP_ID=MMETSP1102-20130122/53287_1 /TAXON_ID=49646 /ORGANISM="Geminigera sp., Strain Caron Lab Isolate" /LENGTH=51 /DNA_ID=CAMNT_0014028047 /DNA_START=16 /DNA_END=168 /DNA_ORIENTATION=+
MAIPLAIFDTTSASGKRLISAILASTNVVCPGCEKASFDVPVEGFVKGESE